MKTILILAIGFLPNIGGLETHLKDLIDELQKKNWRVVVLTYQPLHTPVLGKWIEHTGWYPDYQLRLFRRGKGKYDKHHYHEPIKVTGETGKLSEHLSHYNYEHVGQFLYRSFQVYAPNEAEELLRRGYVFNYADAIRLPFKEFLSRYFAREGYKDGFHGLMLSFLMAFYHFAIFVYIWEKKKSPYPYKSLNPNLQSKEKLITRHDNQEINTTKPSHFSILQASKLKEVKRKIETKK